MMTKKKKKTFIHFYLNLFPRNMFWILNGIAKIKGIAFDPIPFHFIEPSSVSCMCGLWKWQMDISLTVPHIIPMLYVWRFLSVYKWNPGILGTLNKTWLGGWAEGGVGSWSSLASLYRLSSHFISLHSGTEPRAGLNLLVLRKLYILHFNLRLSEESNRTKNGGKSYGLVWVGGPSKGPTIMIMEATTNRCYSSQ